MLLGPVFRFEMSAMGRRKGTFVIRVAYGLLLLLVFSIPLYQMPGLSRAGELSPRELPRVAEAFVASIMVLQALAVLILTPALVAGSLAQERERGNLDLLAASPLSGVEIILGRMFARFCELVIIIAVAVPVLCILSLMGGVDVGIIALSDGVLLTSGFLIAASAIAVSSLSERPRRAILAAYLIVAGWTALPFLNELARNVGAGLVLHLAEWARPIESVLGITNPLYVLSHRVVNPPAMAFDLVATMLVQVALGVFLILTTSAILRPSLRRAGPFGWRWTALTLVFSKRSLLPRPPCGDYPMVWKECNLPKTTILFRVVTVTAALAIAVPLATITWNYAAPAFEELRVHGYGSLVFATARDEFNEFLRATMVCLYVLLALGLAIRSATSITAEKEKSTWTSLLATPMEADEIVAGKLLGAFSGLRWLGLAYVAYLALGLALGSIHPLAGFFSVILMAAMLGTVAEVGLMVSMVSNSSARALAATILTLLALNTLPVFCASGGSELPFSLVLVSPVLLGLSLASFGDLDQLSHGAAPLHGPVLALLVSGLVLHLTAAWALWKSCVSHFDNAVDRPRSDLSSGRSSFRSNPVEVPGDIASDSDSNARGTPPVEHPDPGNLER